MYSKVEAEELRCPYVDKNCVVNRCMAWNWVSKFEDVKYENATLLSDQERIRLENNGYRELPAHGFGFNIKKFFPMTKEECSKIAKNNTYGTQLFFGKDTEDESKWYGLCGAVQTSTNGLV